MRIRAIIFDDNELIRSFLGHIMHQRGYEVLPYSDPGFCPLYIRAGCQCPAGQACSDILISDVNMLMVDGLAFMKSQVAKGCRIRNLALMSGSWSESELQLARRIGCKTFHKPFTTEEIKAWLEECERRIVPCRLLSDWVTEPLRPMAPD